MMKTFNKHAGSALVAGIFLLVTMAALGVAMVRLTVNQHATIGLDVLGARAYQAARAGVEYGLYQQRQTVGTTCSTVGSETTTFAMPATATTLTGFAVTVVCTSTTDANGIVRVQIRATACNPPTGTACLSNSTSPDYVQRVIQVEY
jgi:MSHA biogenesis protein MshP